MRKIRLEHKNTIFPCTYSIITFIFNFMVYLLANPVKIIAVMPNIDLMLLYCLEFVLECLP